MRLGVGVVAVVGRGLGGAGKVVSLALGLIEKAGNQLHHDALFQSVNVRTLAVHVFHYCSRAERTLEGVTKTQMIWVKVRWTRQMDGEQWQAKPQRVDCCSTMSASAHSRGQTPRAQPNGTVKEQPRHPWHPRHNLRR